MFDTELYIDKNSFAHRMHPSVKLVILFLIFVILILTPSYVLAVTLNLFLVALFLFCGVLRLLSRLKYLVILIFVITILMWIFVTQEGNLLYRVGFIKITETGLYKGVISALRLTGMLFAGLFLIATTQLEELAYGLKKIGISERFSFSLTMAIRLIPLYLGSINQIVDAQTSRGHVIDTGGFFARLRNYVPLLIPAFLSSIRNINNLSMALEAKGFSREGKRTEYLHFRITAGILVFVILLKFK